MKKLKNLLLPLAIVFAAIAIFELGTRYGASNVRAIALSGQLQTYLNYYVQLRGNADEASKVGLEKIIDNQIATAVLQRGAWFLRFKEEPRASLERALAYGLSVRGDDVLAHMSSDPNETDKTQIPPENFSEIKRLVAKAREELVQQPDGAAAETPVQ